MINVQIKCIKRKKKTTVVDKIDIIDIVNKNEITIKFYVIESTLLQTLYKQNNITNNTTKNFNQILTYNNKRIFKEWPKGTLSQNIMSSCKIVIIPEFYGSKEDLDSLIGLTTDKNSSHNLKMVPVLKKICEKTGKCIANLCQK